jgi:hypothetical protein
MKRIAKTAYYSIDIDKTKNRIYLTIGGFWKNVTVVPNYFDDIKKAAQEVSPGFTILTDVSQMATPPSDVGSLHEKAQQVLIEAGLKKTAEIIPREKAIEQMVLKKWSVKSGMVKGTFHDKFAAETWLDEKE